MSATWKPVGVLALAFSVVTVLPTIANAAGVANPTFTKDIAPIFQQKCETCHRPDSMAPMSLVTYEEARPWARSIKTRVEARQMPPWSIDKTVGIQDFKNDRSLNDDQIATIINWIDKGAPKGDMKDMPAPAQWLGNAIPLTYYLRVLRGVLLKGSGLAALWPDAAILTLFAVLLVALSVRRFSKTRE